MDSDMIPSKLFDTYEVLPPQDMEGFAMPSYLSGEDIGDMWGMRVIGADTYQERLHT